LFAVRIIILNYNGKELLAKCLPSIDQAAKNSKAQCAVTVLDNKSTDNGLNQLTDQFQDLTIWHAPENRLLCSYNDYVKQIPEPIVIFLNNDIKVDLGFVDPLLQKFKKEPNTFLLAPQVLNFDGTQIQAARSIAGMRLGIFWCRARYDGYVQEAQRQSETYSSGFGAFSRSKFLELGGYDDRYLPGIMEDVDICYRASQKGYKLYYEPKSLVYHMGQVSFKKKFGNSRIKIIACRNTFLFMWKNFHGLRFWGSHLFFLPLRLIFSIIRGDFPFLCGFFQAIYSRWK